MLDPRELNGSDAVINLPGAPIDGRWTSARRARIRDSRVRSTELLARTVLRLDTPPRVFISASAINFYPIDTGSEYDESGPSGEGFLASVCRDWEGAARVLEDSPVRLAVLRIGVVLSAAGGVVAKLRPIFRKGAGGPVGSGRQRMSWIVDSDLAAICATALADERYTGPINAVAPRPITNAAFARAFGRVLKRPAVLPAPAFALRLIYGQMAEETVLADNAVVPGKLLAWDFPYRYPELEPALRRILSEDRGNST